MRGHHRLGTAMEHVGITETIADLDKASPEQLAEWWLATRWLQRQIEATMQGWQRFPSGEPVLCRLGIVIQKWGKPRTAWQSERLIGEVEKVGRTAIAPSLVDPTTGESAHSWEQGVAWYRRFWNLGQPRVTPLRAVSINPDEFCETGPAGAHYQAIDNRDPHLASESTDD